MLIHYSFNSPICIHQNQLERRWWSRHLGPGPSQLIPPEMQLQLHLGSCRAGRLAEPTAANNTRGGLVAVQAVLSALFSRTKTADVHSHRGGRNNDATTDRSHRLHREQWDQWTCSPLMLCHWLNRFPISLNYGIATSERVRRLIYLWNLQVAGLTLRRYFRVKVHHVKLLCCFGRMQKLW